MTVIGIDCGGTEIRGATFEGIVRQSNVERRPTPGDHRGIAKAIIELCESLPSSQGVGLGVAGHVRDGRLRWMPHATGDEIDLAAMVTDQSSMPCVVANDANVAALAEARHGAGAAYGTVAFVGIGTGIGLGIVVDGSIVTGRGAAGEIGHTKIVPNGPPCACGGHGCWEAMVSGKALRNRFGIEDLSTAPNRDEIIADQAEWLGIGLANLVEVLDPHVVVIGGGLAQLGDRLLDPARLAVARTLSGRRDPPPIVIAEFGQEAGMVGAAIFAQEEIA